MCMCHNSSHETQDMGWDTLKLSTHETPVARNKCCGETRPDVARVHCTNDHGAQISGWYDSHNIMKISRHKSNSRIYLETRTVKTLIYLINSLNRRIYFLFWQPCSSAPQPELRVKWVSCVRTFTESLPSQVSRLLSSWLFIEG